MQVPIQKREEGGKVTIAKDKTASNFQVFFIIASIFYYRENVQTGSTKAQPGQRAEQVIDPGGEGTWDEEQGGGGEDHQQGQEVWDAGQQGPAQAQS